jgi:hypothetical protein
MDNHAARSGCDRRTVLRVRDFFECSLITPIVRSRTCTFGLGRESHSAQNHSAHLLRRVWAHTFPAKMMLATSQLRGRLTLQPRRTPAGLSYDLRSRRKNLWCRSHAGERCSACAGTVVHYQTASKGRKGMLRHTYPQQRLKGCLLSYRPCRFQPNFRSPNVIRSSCPLKRMCLISKPSTSAVGIFRTSTLHR